MAARMTPFKLKKCKKCIYRYDCNFHDIRKDAVTVIEATDDGLTTITFIITDDHFTVSNVGKPKSCIRNFSGEPNSITYKTTISYLAILNEATRLGWMDNLS